jgi:hypothetical protein
MAEIIFRLPGNEQYSYAEVKFESDEYDQLSGDEVQSKLFAAWTDLNATFPNSGGSNSSPAPSGTSQQSNSNIPSCPHGQREEKSGASARGPWKAYMCPSKNRNNQCKPIDAITGQPWK